MGGSALRLNLGCGFDRREGWVNVDAFASCNPDIVHDLNAVPYPWADDSVHVVLASHVLEHLDDWWSAFQECARILVPGGTLEVRVPDESSSTAMGWRDHKHLFTRNSFHGCVGFRHGTNAWAMEQIDSVPLRLTAHYQVPHSEYFWLRHFPAVLRFCARHLRNFIKEQRFHFVKSGRDE